MKDSRWLISIYTLILLSANFVGDYSLQIFYFTFSMGTLVMQLVFCGVLVFTETFIPNKITKIIGITALINLLIAFWIYYGLGFSIPAFWSKEGSVDHTINWQILVVLMFSLSYVCTALSMVYCAAILKRILGLKWLSVRVALILLISLVVDMIALAPIIYYLGSDHYLVLWKMLSLISVKITLTLLAIPLSYLFIIFLKRGSDLTLKPDS